MRCCWGTTQVLMLLVPSLGLWHFGRMLWVGLSTGVFIAPHVLNRAPVTREKEPARFWYSMAVALLFVLLCGWLGVFLLRSLVRFLELFA
jgi:hypothetical protein